MKRVQNKLNSGKIKFEFNTNYNKYPITLLILLKSSTIDNFSPMK